MISKKDYKIVSAGWVGKVYQKYKKLKKRIPMLIEHLEFFKGERVLEIGANAGMYAWHFGVVAKRYTCLEVDKNYFNQLKCVSKAFDKGIYDCKYMLINDKLRYANIDFSEYSLLMMSYVAHHLDTVELDIIYHALKKINKVVIHTRSGDPLRYGHDEIDKNPLPMWNDCMVKGWLDKFGYESKFYFREEGVYDGIYLILAEKK